MTIYPAIDCSNGDAFGFFGKSRSGNRILSKPGRPRPQLEDSGADHLHVVDLDETFLVVHNLDAVRSILQVEGLRFN